MGFCPKPGVERIKAFGNEEERWWCSEHAEVAKANLEAEEMYGRND